MALTGGIAETVAVVVGDTEKTAAEGPGMWAVAEVVVARCMPHAVETVGTQAVLVVVAEVVGGRMEVMLYSGKNLVDRGLVVLEEAQSLWVEMNSRKG